jgi:HD domain
VVEDPESEGIQPVELLSEPVRVETATKVVSALDEARAAIGDNQRLAHDVLADLRGVVDLIAASIADSPDAALFLGDLAGADQYTHRHSVNVTALGLLLGRAYWRTEGWVDFRGRRRWDRIDDRLAKLGMGLLLYDIGKMVVPAEVLDKPGKLDSDEWALMKTHPDAGVALLDSTTISPLVRSVVRDHHERYDGSGYPRGIAGELIGEFPRLAAVADVYDAITSQRPYAPAEPRPCRRAGDRRGRRARVRSRHCPRLPPDRDAVSGGNRGRAAGPADRRRRGGRPGSPARAAGARRRYRAARRPVRRRRGVEVRARDRSARRARIDADSGSTLEATMRRGIAIAGLAVAASVLAPASAGGDGLPVTGVDAGWSGVATPESPARYVTVPAGRATLLARVRRDGGQVLGSRLLRTAFTIPAVALDGSASGLSADGRTLVLIRPRTAFPRARTPLAVVDAQRLRVRRVIRLDGDFSFDALSPDGATMYLIEYTSPRDPTRYAVRAGTRSSTRSTRVSARRSASTSTR